MVVAKSGIPGHFSHKNRYLVYTEKKYNADARSAAIGQGYIVTGFASERPSYS